MFFNDLIQRRLVSLLQPWLNDEVELDVQLGFLRSHAKLENLTFNTSALNELLDDPTRLCFKQVTVQQLSLHVSNWSAPAFDFQIHGLNVVLSVGEEEEDGVRRRPKPRDSSIEEREKILAELDPEGSVLHNTMKMISEVTAGSWTTHLFDWILQQCRLQVFDAHFFVQSPLSNDLWSLSFEMKEVGVQCKHIKGCLLTGLVNSVFLPSGENTLDLNVQQVDISLRRGNYISCIFPSTDLLASAKVKHLQFRELNFYAAALNFSLSPSDISIILVLFALWSKESNRARTGKQLWEIAATKSSSLTSTPKFAFHKIASTMCLWLRYVHAYEKMLLLVGYPADDAIKKFTTVVVQSEAYSRTLKQQWEVISQIEKELPVEAIVQARRIIRYKASSSGQQSKDGGHGSTLSRICWKICQSLSLIWMVVCSVLHSVKGFLLLKKKLVRNQDICHKLGVINEDHILGSHICLYIGDFCISVSPDNEVPPSFNRKLVSDVGHSYPGLLTFCLSIDFFCLRYSEDVSEHSFSFACGSLKVVSSSLTDDKANKFNNNFKGRPRKNVHNLQPTLWGEPNQILHSTETGGANPPHDSGGDCVNTRNSLIEQACLNWRKFSSRFRENEIQNMENPFLLCEIKGFLTDQSLKNLTAGYTTCYMVMGKLNLVLEYTVIVSLTVICRQINAISWTTSRIGTTVVEGGSRLDEDPPVADWNSKYKSYSAEIKVMMPRLLPEKHMQIAIHIAGPRIKLTLRKEDFHGVDMDLYHKLGNDEVRLSFDADDIELGASPNLESDLTSSSGDTAVFDAELLKDLEQIDIAKPNGEVNSSRGCTSLSAYLILKGLKVSLDTSWDNQGFQIVELNPLTIRLLSLRKDLHSLGSIDISLSIVMHCMSSGLKTLVLMDEFAVLLKVISGLLCTVFQVFSTSSLDLSQSDEDLLRREFTDSESERAPKNRITQVASVLTDTTFNVSTKCELRSVNMSLYDSRKGYNAHNSVADANTIADRKSTVQPIRSCGINISLARSYIRFSFEEEKADVLIGFSKFESDISRYQDEIVDTSDQVEPQLPVLSLNSLYQASVPHCEISLSVVLGNNILQASQRNVVGGSDSRHDASMSSNHSPSLVNDVNPSFDWLTINISLAEVYLARCAVKNLFLRDDEPNTLKASLSVGGHFQKISCQSQGGSIIVEIAALVTMVECYGFYCNQLGGLWPAMTEHLVAQNDVDSSLRRSSSNQQLEQHKLVNWDPVEEFAVNLSRVSLALVDGDKSDELQKLQLEGNGKLELELPRKFSFHITNLSILSQLLHISTEQQSQETELHISTEQQSQETETPFLSSFISNDQSSIIVHDDTLVAPNYLGEVNSITNEASSSSPPELGNQYHADDSRKPWRGGTSSQISLATPQNYVLKDLNANLMAEPPLKSSGSISLKSNDFWVGSGSISHFDMTLSLREIQIILFAGESLSAIFCVEATKSIEQTHQKNSGEYSRSLDERSLDEMVPDGTIVSIKDIDQHMYVAVDNAESGYNLVGAIHYSLVGEKALFRVKHHHVRSWNSQVQYLSFISLYAKDESGEPLRLNCHRRSDFVEISSSSATAWALWRALPYKHDIYDGDVDLETYLPQTKNKFYLVNKKNDCAAAFVNGVLEVVSKPGHSFKFKVFRDPSPYVNNIFLDGCLEKKPGAVKLHDSCISEGKDLSQLGNSFGITVSVDKVSLTIVHELSDSKERTPLLQGSISPTEVVIQISNTKVRVMSGLEVLLYYFDSQKDIRRELMHPLEIDVFYRYRFQNQALENNILWVPGHFYARIKELSMTITELSMDIILFVVGELNLAGPYSVRISTILANCCKVENQSGLSLSCQFYDNQDVSVAGRHSTTIFLRHMAWANRPPEASFFSIQLMERGLLSTSVLHLSLLETQSFAWRPRIVSLQESKTFPGPFLVAEVSPRTEDCLSIVVSPLLRIHNDTDFSMELRFQRPQHKEIDYASVRLKAGDTIDDSKAAFDAINFSGERKKTLNSLSVGNFLFSFRPEVTDNLTSFENPSACWSDDLRGGKPVRLSGIFDKLTYQVRKAFSFQSMKYSLSTAHCDIKSEDGQVAKIHFLIESIGKDVPIIQPDNFGYARVDKSSPVALQEQKEIFLLPTVSFSNFLDMEIHVKLNDTGLPSTNGVDCICNEATIPSGSSVNLYANPAAIYFIVTLTSFDTSCKPINSGDSAKRLQKRKSKVQFLDIELDFGNGKYFALLRLSRGLRGILEAAVFTSYTLENNTEFSLFCFPANHKPFSRHEVENIVSPVSPELGYYLPPRSIKPWFSKCHKVQITLLDERASEAPLDLDALSGLTGLNLEVEGKSGSKTVTKLGVSLKPSVSKVVPLQVVSMYPRYVILNESDEDITVRQCFLEEDGTDTIVTLNSKQRAPLTLRSRNEMTTMKRNTFLENLIKKHAKSQNDSSFFVQFQPNKASYSWSGPVCIASLGRFFLKFKKSEYSVQQSDLATQRNSDMYEFATVHVVEDGPTVVLRFRWPANMDLPYRIENRLENTSITYYQKGLIEPEVLASGSNVGYVWDDLILAHKLVVQIDAVHLLREINLDKVREWKPFYRTKQQRGLGFHLPLEKKPEDPKKNNYGQLTGMDITKLGYEVYAEGLTRVLRICEYSDRRRGETSFHSCTKMQLRISYFAIQLLERANQDVVDKDNGNGLMYNPIIMARLNRIDFDAMFAEKHKLNHLSVQSLSVEPKWVGAPFASILRRHQIENCDTNDCVLRVGLVLASSSSSVKHVRHLSIVLQPLDFNLDEETLMRIVPFWRTSLSDTNTPSQKHYIDHFEIHPVKVVASFLPGESYASYSSKQETLRSLLHSVIKIPPIKNMTVELNGILVTHALVTLRELSIKCAQHYSWYAMRAVYIAKGSPLLPPAFASIFDDLASSSLDVFFDPSTGLVNLPGLTIGTFKLISKCIDDKGFSGSKRYFGDLGKTLKSGGSNILFAAVTEISDSVLKGAEASGLNGMVNGFHQGILKLAMEPMLLGSAFMEGGPDRKIRLDRSPGVDELYIEGYLQAMLDTLYKQEYLRVKVIDDQVILKNLPPSSSLIEEIVERVKGFLVSKALLKGDSSTASRSLRHIRGEREWRVVPTVLTLVEHLFVSFAIRVLRKQASKAVGKMNWKQKVEADDQKAIVPASGQKLNFVWKWGIGKFVLSGILAYVDGRLCRYISNPIARRIVSGFLLSLLERNDE
ncbi:uncharacterized protein LOC132625246 isoform X2 [Lycium barbarum]|uniref:uncharacterized protein LOC132625246 isoform X2 n=1 Tax=Lycium barbarum TaxID=112863 RepID=UPI00293E97A0|nr:uncharacterized protein LOC132625246 isoform X2 [Lycium barbarum]